MHFGFSSKTTHNMYNILKYAEPFITEQIGIFSEIILTRKMNDHWSAILYRESYQTQEL